MASCSDRYIVDIVPFQFFFVERKNVTAKKIRSE